MLSATKELQLVPQEDPNDTDLEEHENAEDKETKPQRVDTKALNGLRGVAAVHIMIGHYLDLGYNYDLLFVMMLPFFFLISGFVFGMKEGATNYELTKCCGELRAYSDGKDHFDGKNFYKRRMARTLPLYYLSNLVMVPVLWCYRWDDPPPEFNGVYIGWAYYVSCFFVVTTWFGVRHFLMNTPSWFVSTIWFFYWIFPSLLPRLQRFDVAEKRKWIVWNYWIQLVVGTAVIWIADTFPWDIALGSGAHEWQWWPPMRLPVFVMGILAGLLRTDGLPVQAEQDEMRPSHWRKKSDQMAFSMIVFFVVVPAMRYFKWVVFKVKFVKIIMVWFQLQLIQSLTFEGGDSHSVCYQALTHGVTLEFGRISYALYLIHWPIRDYFQWMMAVVNDPNCEDWTQAGECGEGVDLDPWWSVPVLITASVFAAFILNRYFEEPLRKCLRPGK